MIKGIYNWFKGLSEGARIVISLVSFTVLVSGTTLAIDHFRSKVVNANAVINYLVKSDLVRTKNEHDKDSIENVYKNALDLRLDHFSDSISLVITNTKKVTNSVATMAVKLTNTVPEFLNIMNGLEFTLIQPIQTKSLEDFKPDIRIKIQKKIK
jgi:hypothetical protein